MRASSGVPVPHAQAHGMWDVAAIGPPVVAHRVFRFACMATGAAILRSDPSVLATMHWTNLPSSVAPEPRSAWLEVEWQKFWYPDYRLPHCVGPHRALFHRPAAFLCPQTKGYCRWSPLTGKHRQLLTAGGRPLSGNWQPMAPAVAVANE